MQARETNEIVFGFYFASLVNEFNSKLSQCVQNSKKNTQY